MLVVFCLLTSPARAAFYVNVANAQRYGVRPQYGPFNTYAAAQAFINQNDPSFRGNMTIIDTGPSAAEIAAAAQALKYRTINDQALASYDKGDYATSEAEFKQCLEYWPNDPALLKSIANCEAQISNNQGVAYSQNNDWANAILCYQAALAKNPDNKIMQQNLAQAQTRLANDKGNAFYAQGDWANAIACYQEAVNKNPFDNNSPGYKKRLEAAQHKLEQGQQANDIQQSVQSLAHTLSAAPATPENVDNNSGLDFIDSSTPLNAGVNGNQSGHQQQQTPDTGDKKLFKTKQAIEDALTAKAHGEVGIGALAGNLPDITFSREILNDAVTAAKTETDQKFAQLLVNDRHFDTVVIPGDSGSQAAAQPQTLKVPVELQNDKRFQKLVIEGEALHHQDQALGKQIQTIKADPAYKQDPTKLVKVDQLESVQHGIQGMEGYINNVTVAVVAKPTIISSVDFGDSSPPPKRPLDRGIVPSPTQ